MILFCYYILYLKIFWKSNLMNTLRPNYGYFKMTLVSHYLRFCIRKKYLPYYHPFSICYEGILYSAKLDM